jgi:hypothetical protein
LFVCPIYNHESKKTRLCYKKINFPIDKRGGLPVKFKLYEISEVMQMKFRKTMALATVVVSMLTAASCVAIEVTVPAINVPAISNLYDPDGSGSADSADSGSSDSNATPSADTGSADTGSADSGSSETAAPTEATQASADNGSASSDNGSSSTATEAQTQAAKTDTSTNTGSSSSAPSTKEEIIQYYVTAYNKIATDAKTVTRTYDNTTNYKNICDIGSNATVKKTAQTLMTKFMKPTTDAIVMSASDLPPVGVTKLSISSSQISSATCTDKGTYYEIVLKSTGTDSNYEVDSVAGKGSAGVLGPLLRTEDVSSAAGSFVSFEGLHAKYATCTTTCKVDKTSGHITEFNFNSPCILHFDSATVVKIVKIENCELGLLFEQKWTIAY